MTDTEKLRKDQLAKGEKMVKNAKNWIEYWNGIDYVIASIGYDTKEQYDKLEQELDEKYGHTLA